MHHSSNAAALGHVKSAGRGAYAHAADFFTKVVISVAVCTGWGWVVM